MQIQKDKRSFFEKLTGAVRLEDQDENFDNNLDYKNKNVSNKKSVSVAPSWTEEESEEGELTVDVFQTPTEIVIKTMVAGVRPEDLDISITRDMVTIKGKREAEKVINEEDYFHQELYWGSFARTIVLPAEIEVEEAEAIEKHGLLIIHLPKIDKNKQAKIKVRGN